MKRSLTALASAVVFVLALPGLAGGTHSDNPTGPPQDFSSGGWQGSSGGFKLHARYTGHLPADQPGGGAFDGVRGEAVVTHTNSSGTSTKHKGDLLCGHVSGNSASFLYRLREPHLGTHYLALIAFDRGSPNEAQPDMVAFAFVSFSSPPEETRECSAPGFVYEQTRGNVVVHDG